MFQESIKLIDECNLTHLHVFPYSPRKNTAASRMPQIENPAKIRECDESRVLHSDEEVVIAHNWDELRRFMWDYVGIVRTNKRLERAQNRIKLLKTEIQEYYGNYKVNRDLLELRNLVTVSDLIIQCATKRRESRGLHFTLDYPDLSSEAKDSIIVPDGFA